MTAAAHRHSALRFWLAAFAAVEAGALIAIVVGWTPGRAVVAAVGLGLGAVAAVATVILMGTTRPIGRRLGTAMSLALMVSLLVPMASGSIADPTQVRVPDLSLSVTCTVAPDAQTVTADVAFSWQRLDLWPAGAAGSSGIDELAVYAQLPEWIDAELGMPVEAGGPMPLVSLESMDSGPWPASSMDPVSQTLDGRPVGGLITTAASADYIFGPGTGSSPVAVNTRIVNAALRAGGRYAVISTFQRNADYSPERSSRDMLPTLVVEYRHLQRFTVQAFGSCADPSRTWPGRSEEWQRY
jgi:hypothetical protein